MVGLLVESVLGATTLCDRHRAGGLGGYAGPCGAVSIPGVLHMCLCWVLGTERAQGCLTVPTVTPSPCRAQQWLS